MLPHEYLMMGMSILRTTGPWKVTRSMLIMWAQVMNIQQQTINRIYKNCVNI